MLFNSLEFCVFFPLVTIGYFCLPYERRWPWLLATSCVFYMWLVPSYILILAFTIVIDYVAGLAIERAQGRRRKAFLVVSLIANLGVLAVFKYADFLIGTIRDLAGLVGSHYVPPELHILLPVGLSFHTFQAMSYTIEVYYGRQPAERHFGIYALYVMFYPQMVAGPIERPQNLLWQFRERHDFDYQRITSGLQLIALGMFKKVVFAAPTQFSAAEHLTAAFFFAFQIYWDFSGYSDIARGSARVMGFTLMRNFDTPYLSTSVAEFWRRWHMSLSTWFRDYLYVPLGGGRVPPARYAFNVTAVFLLSGLWHGAHWNFVIWGGLHGLFLICGRITGPLRAAVRDRTGVAPDGLLSRLVGAAVTFSLVCLAWIFFRASTFDEALFMVRGILTHGVTDVADVISGRREFQLRTSSCALRFAVIAGMFAIEYWDRRRSVFERLADRPVVLRFAVYLLITYATVFGGLFGVNRQFIYFQF